MQTPSEEEKARVRESIAYLRGLAKAIRAFRERIFSDLKENQRIHKRLNELTNNLKDQQNDSDKENTHES